MRPIAWPILLVTTVSPAKAADRDADRDLTPVGPRNCVLDEGPNFFDHLFVHRGRCVFGVAVSIFTFKCFVHFSTQKLHGGCGLNLTPT